MKLFIFFLICSFLLSPRTICAQQFTEVVPLSSDLGESSGLIYLNGKIITHTDSQGEAALYEVDSITGNYTRKVIVANASNGDWEDITTDSTHIFIGDFGNNGGNRTNLRIYRVLISDYINTPNDTVFCDTIRFSYADQNVFNYNPQATNWDCEAVVAIGDSLYLFTKNWVNAKTYVYPLSKNPGTYIATKTDSIFVQGLITGADYHVPSNRLILCGYTQYPFVVEMNDPLGGAFGQNSFVRYNLPSPNLIQLEAVVTFDDNSYYLTAETFQAIAVRLYRLEGLNGISDLHELSNLKWSLSPNPTTGFFKIETTQFLQELDVQILSMDGNLIRNWSGLSGANFELDVHLPSGVYFVCLTVNNKSFYQRLVVQ